MKKNKLQQSSSEEQDDEDNYVPTKQLPKSAVFTHKVLTAPIIELKDQELDVSKSQAEEDEGSHLRPKLKDNISPPRPNSSNVYLKNVSSVNGLLKKQITNAYTFKLKSPVVTKKKKNDPVALFQQTSNAWKKDRFLTSRANAKQGRKLELQKRNKDVRY